MRAAVLRSAGDLRIEDVPVPDPGPGELLIRVGMVGICGTDAAEYAHGPYLFRMPLIPGHELGGWVAGLGVGVTGFSVGDLVASTGATSCGACSPCRAGRPSRCPDYLAVGLHRDGGLAEFCVVPADSCLEVGSRGLTAETAALAQPMSIAVHALRRGGIQGGERVVVVGAGGIGAFVIHAAASAGCEVTAVDIDPDRLAIASELGARSSLTEADVVFEITGSEGGLSTAIAALAPGGRLVMVGFQKHLATVDVASLTAHEQEWVGTNRIDTDLDLPHAIELLARRSWEALHIAVIGLDEVTDRLQAMGRGERVPIKTLVSPIAAAGRPSSFGQ